MDCIESYLSVMMPTSHTATNKLRSPKYREVKRCVNYTFIYLRSMLGGVFSGRRLDEI
jgi:hypothetical protein